MSRSPLVVPTLAIVFSALGALLSPTTSLAVDDDFEFAEALLRRGYVDLAEEKFQEFIQKGGPKRGDGEYGLASLKGRSATAAAAETAERLRKPVDDVLLLFEEGDGAWAQFIKNNADHERNLDAKLERARLLQLRGEYIKTVLEKGWATKLGQGDLLTKMAQGFDTSVELLQPVEDRARAAYEKAQQKYKPDDPEYQDAAGELAVVWLYRLVSLYGKGECLPEGDAAGTAAVDKVVKEVEDFLWEFEDRLQGVWALHYRGLAYAKKNDSAEAFADLKGAAVMATKSDNPAVRKVTFDSYTELATACLRFGVDENGDWPARAMQEFKEFGPGGRWADFDKDGPGQRAGLAWARLLDYAGDPQAALQVAQRVLKAAVQTRTGVDRQAGALVATLLQTAGASGKVAPGDLERVASTKWRDGETREALQAFQAVISTCRTPEQMNEFGWNAWDSIGRIYAGDGRWYEAYVAFTILDEAYDKQPTNTTLDQITDETGFLRAQALARLSREIDDRAESDKWKKRADDLLTEFANRKPNSPYNQDAALQAAAGKLSEAKRTKRDDPALALPLFEEAVKLFQQVPKDSPSIDLVGARIAEIRFHQEKFDEAVKLSRQWLDNLPKLPTTNSSKVRRARAQGENVAYNTLVRALAGAFDASKAAGKEARAAAGKALFDALAQHEADFLKSSEGGGAQILLWRIECYASMGQIDEAEKLAWQFINGNKEHPNARYVAALVGAMVEADARVWESKGDVPRTRNLYIRAAKLKEFVLDTSPGGERNPDVVRAVGTTYQKGEEWDKAEGLLTEALKLYEAATKQEQADSVRVQLIDLLIDRGKYDDAIPQLEAQLVTDPKDRPTVLARLRKDTNFTKVELDALLEKMSKNRGLINSLSRAYLKAKNKDRLVACMNLTFLLRHAHPKEKIHDADYVTYTVRLAQAYFEYGVDQRDAASLGNCVALLKNQVVVVKLLDSYDEALPGSKRTIENLLATAEIERNKLK